MKVKLLCSALLIGLMVSPAMANIAVSLEPTNTSWPIGGGDFTVDIVADIPQSEAIVGWGLDLNILDPTIAAMTGTVTLGGDFQQAANEDSDGLAGLAFPSEVWGTDVLLATVELAPLAVGLTDVTLSDDYPTDLTEGFALFGGGFATVDYQGGTIEITPEPAALALLALGTLLRRR